MNPDKLAVFETHESAARAYCRGFPVLFSKAKGSHLYDEDGQAYIDFLCGDVEDVEALALDPKTKSRALVDVHFAIHYRLDRVGSRALDC